MLKRRSGDARKGEKRVRFAEQDNEDTGQPQPSTVSRAIEADLTDEEENEETKFMDWSLNRISELKDEVNHQKDRNTRLETNGKWNDHHRKILIQENITLKSKVKQLKAALKMGRSQDSTSGTTPLEEQSTLTPAVLKATTGKKDVSTSSRGADVDAYIVDKADDVIEGVTESRKEARKPGNAGNDGPGNKVPFVSDSGPRSGSEADDFQPKIQIDVYKLVTDTKPAPFFKYIGEFKPDENFPCLDHDDVRRASLKVLKRYPLGPGRDRCFHFLVDDFDVTTDAVEKHLVGRKQVDEWITKTAGDIRVSLKRCIPILSVYVCREKDNLTALKILY